MKRTRTIAATATADTTARAAKTGTTAMMTALIAMALCLCLSGCVGALPGGSESINKSYYDTHADLEAWVDSLQAGMSKEETFARLGRVEKNFKRLTRSQIVGTLFGGEDAGIPVHFHTDESILAFLESLEGYRIEHKNVKRRHGLASIIRLQTDSKGYDYTLSLIFKEGKLYQKPYLTGGQINNTSTKTIFDYLDPGMAIGVARDAD